MTQDDVEPLAFRLKLTGRIALAEILQWTASNVPEYLVFMDYDAGHVYPELWPDPSRSTLASPWPSAEYNRWHALLPRVLFEAGWEEYKSLRK